MTETFLELRNLYGFIEMIHIGDDWKIVTHVERPSQTGTLTGVLNRRLARLYAGVPLSIVDELWNAEGGPALAWTGRPTTRA